MPPTKGQQAKAAAKIEECLEDIKKAEFVAIDTEFTGIFDPPTRSCNARSLEEFLEMAADSASQFSTIQLGVCTARRESDEDPFAWTLTAHNFMTCPDGQARVFKVDVASLTFLRQHDFDFNEWLDTGIPHSKLAPIFHALRKSKVVVVHHGLFDLLQTATHFISAKDAAQAGSGDGEAYAVLPEPLRLWVDRPGTSMVFDTRHVAQEGRYTVLEALDRSLSPDPLLAHLLSKPYKSKFKLKPGEEEYVLPTDAKNDEDYPSHEAGYDALVTGLIFILLMERFMGHRDARRKLKRTADGEPKGPDEDKRPEGSLPLAEVDCQTALPNWVQHKVCQRFADTIALNFAPGCLAMKPKKSS